MENNFEKPIKELFEYILGGDVKISNSTNLSKEGPFLILMERLENTRKKEIFLLEKYGTDITSFTEGLWAAVDSLLESLYGLEKQDVIMWYLFDRFDNKGKIIPLEDIKGREVYIKTSRQLWHYLRNNIGKENGNDSLSEM